MNSDTLKHLNRLLRDHLGTTPNGAGLYEWMDSRDRRLFAPMGRFDSAAMRMHYEMEPQIPERRWTLAIWIAPPSQRQWEAQFQGQIGYPRGGYYTPVSTPWDSLFERGFQPNERATNHIIGMRKQQLEMGMMGVYRAIKESQQYKERERDRMMDDILTDRWTAFSNVPGTKSHVSFPTV